MEKHLRCSGLFHQDVFARPTTPLPASLAVGAPSAPPPSTPPSAPPLTSPMLQKLQKRRPHPPLRLSPWPARRPSQIRTVGSTKDELPDEPRKLRQPPPPPLLLWKPKPQRMPPTASRSSASVCAPASSRSRSRQQTNQRTSPCTLIRRGPPTVLQLRINQQLVPSEQLATTPVKHRRSLGPKPSSRGQSVDAMKKRHAPKASPPMAPPLRPRWSSHL